ncbi:MAG: hypothetical protein DRP93_07865 [Candidatus Neomarinimicrobiota bacterium]|nr:MAG: hypothetical protein DRP93_07865 [Candidatus Neomarinimicrobiota bacterium]
MLVFLYFQVSFFGVNDLFAVIFIFISAVIMYNVIFDLQVGNKKALRVNTREGGFLYTFLTHLCHPILK